MGFRNRGFTNRALAALLIMIATVFAFQNCGAGGVIQLDLPQFNASVDGTTQGNGSGYDGKIYVHLSNTETCADQLAYDRAIAGRDGKFYLTRDNCADIPVESQISVAAVPNPNNPTIIYYETQLFSEQLDQVHVIHRLAAGYLSAGSTYSITDKAIHSEGKYVGRFDSRGRPIWAKRYSYPLVKVRAFVKMKPLSDGGLVLTGGTYEDDLPEDAADPVTWITRFAANGEIIWRQRLDMDGMMGVWIDDLKVDQSDNIYLTLYARRNDGTKETMIAKLRADGSPVFTRALDVAAGSRSVLRMSPAGELYIFGKSEGRLFMVGLSDTGDAKFTSFIEGLEVGVGGVQPWVDFTAEGNLILTGNLKVPISGLPGWFWSYGRILEYAPNGDAIAAYRFEDNALFNYGVSTLKEGGFVLPLESERAGIDYVRLNRDFSVDWSVAIPSSAEFNRPFLLKTDDGSFFAKQAKIASLSLYWTDILAPIDPSRIPESCPSCQRPNHRVVAADDVGRVLPGPLLRAREGLRSTPTTRIEFTDVTRYLPLEEKPR